MKRISGITYLKAILPIFVVSCHIRPFGASSAMSKTFSGIPTFKDIFYTNISTLAVPLFLVISMCLYLLKRSKTDIEPKKLLYKRIFYLLKLFVIWVGISYLFAKVEFWVDERGTLCNIYRLLFCGASTIFYYFQISIYLLVLLELFYYFTKSIPEKRKKSAVAGTAISCCVLAICLFSFVPFTIRTEALRYFSPIGFLPYVFIASFIFETKDSVSEKRILATVLLIIGVVLAIVEWKYFCSVEYLSVGFSVVLPSYQKLSVVAVSSAVFMLMLRIKKEPSRIVQYMSELSLFVYCVHQFVIYFVQDVKTAPLVKYLFVLVITYIISIIINFAVKYVKSKDFKRLFVRGNKNEV